MPRFVRAVTKRARVIDLFVRGKRADSGVRYLLASQPGAVYPSVVCSARSRAAPRTGDLSTRTQI